MASTQRVSKCNLDKAQIVSVLILVIVTIFVSQPSYAGYQLHVMDLTYGDGKAYTVLSFKQIEGPNVSVNQLNGESIEGSYQLKYDIGPYGSYGNAFANDYFPKPLRPDGLDRFIENSVDRAQRWIDQTYADRGVVDPGTSLAQNLKEKERLCDGRSSFILITEFQNPSQILGMLRMSHRGNGDKESLPMELSLGIRFPRPEQKEISYTKYDSHHDMVRRIGHLIPFEVVPIVRPDGNGIERGSTYISGDLMEIKNFALVPGNKRLFPILLYVAEILGMAREGQRLPGYQSPAQQWENAHIRPRSPWDSIDYSYHYNFTGTALPSMYVIESKGELLGYYRSLGFHPVNENLEEIEVESSQSARKNKLYKLAISRQDYVGLLEKVGAGKILQIQPEQKLTLVTSKDITRITHDILATHLRCSEIFR